MKGSISADKHILTNTTLLSIKKGKFHSEVESLKLQRVSQDEQSLAGQAVAESECDLEDSEQYKQCMRSCPMLQMWFLHGTAQNADLRPFSRSKYGEVGG